GVVGALAGLDALLAQQVGVLGLDALGEGFLHRLLQQLAFGGLAQERDQALAQGGAAELGGAQRVLHRRDARAVGAAQVVFGGVGLDHGQVAALALGLGHLGLGRRARGQRRGGAFVVGERARDLAGAGAAARADLGAGAVQRALGHGVAADLHAALVPAVELLLRRRRLLPALRARGERKRREDEPGDAVRGLHRAFPPGRPIHVAALP